MARHYYRCNKCRTRNTFSHPVDWYKRPRQCRCCGHGRFYVDKERVARKPCYCDGGLLVNSGSIPHRPGSKCCVLNPDHPWHRAQREGASEAALMEIAIELAWEADGGRPAPDAPPF